MDLINSEKIMEKNKLKSKILIGIMSYSTHNSVPTYSTDNEINCFDFYRNYDGKIFVNGKLV